MEINEEELTTTSALEAAWDAEESALEEPNELPDSEVLEASEQPDNATDGEGPADDPELQSPRDGVKADVQGEDKPHNEQPKDEGDEKPPVGLSATAREAWKDTPKAMRDEMHRREQGYAQGIQKYAEAAKRVQSMDRSLEPYKQLFAMNGGAQQFMPNLLQTASMLQMGTGPQKAQMVAQMIQQFGVDLPMLDQVLSGAQPQQGQPAPPDINQLVDQRFQQRDQQQQEAHMQQINVHAGNEVNMFGMDVKNEFYQDVKMDMADILDMAARRNQEMTLSQAYDKACKLNPEISAIIGGRTSQKTVQRKRRAASPISGSFGGDGDAGAPDSMRGAIESAWEGQGQI